MDVFDDQSQNMKSNIEEFPKPPTAILAPPPTPMGGPMLGPSVPIIDMQSKTPILMPPPTPLGGSMVGTPVLVNKNMEPDCSFQSPTPHVGVSAASIATFLPSASTNMSTNIPPPMMNIKSPSFATGPPPSKGYPKPVAYPSPSNLSNQMGMDPTAPLGMKTARIGPPPTGGFMRK